MEKHDFFFGRSRFCGHCGFLMVSGVSLLRSVGFWTYYNPISEVHYWSLTPEDSHSSFQVFCCAQPRAFFSFFCALMKLFSLKNVWSFFFFEVSMLIVWGHKTIRKNLKFNSKKKRKQMCQCCEIKLKITWKETKRQHVLFRCWSPAR